MNTKTLGNDVYLAYTEDKLGVALYLGIYDNFDNMSNDIKKYTLDKINQNPNKFNAQILSDNTFMIKREGSDDFEHVKYVKFPMNQGIF